MRAEWLTTRTAFLRRRARYEPDVEPELDPAGGAPWPLPADGAPWEPEPLPMLGQFRVEPDPELEPEFEDELDEPLLVLPDPVLLVLDDGVVVEELEVEEPELELEPVVPVLPVFEVVAASAASAPPAKRPDVSAPTAKTLRKRICMSGCPFVCCVVRSVRSGTAHDAPATCGVAQSDRSASVELVDDPMTIHS